MWADVLVRDASTLASLTGEPGLLQLINVLARGAPCHSVLTEDLGRIVAGACPCGRSGTRFELLGRVPKPSCAAAPMFETSFVAGGRRTRLLLPFRLEASLEDWAALRSAMARQKPDAFTRDEWAYLMGFLDRDFLEGVFRQAFGEREQVEGAPAPRGRAPGRRRGPLAAEQRQPPRAADADPASLTGNASGSRPARAPTT